MNAVRDFEDMLSFLQKHKVRYLIIGGLAFIYHAKPRYTKDMDLWIDPEKKNIDRANAALAEFGSPVLLEYGKRSQIVQIGVAPNRIDLLFTVSGLRFETAWKKRIRGHYGKTRTSWIDMDSLIHVKRRIDSSRHQEDVRVLMEVKRLKRKR